MSEAEGLVREALERSRRVMGSSHPDTRATTQTLTDLLRKQGRSDEADALAH